MNGISSHGSSLKVSTKRWKAKQKPLSYDHESYAKGFFVGDCMEPPILLIALSITYAGGNGNMLLRG